MVRAHVLSRLPWFWTMASLVVCQWYMIMHARQDPMYFDRKHKVLRHSRPNAFQSKIQGAERRHLARAWARTALHAGGTKMFPLSGQAARPEVSPCWKTILWCRDVQWMDSELHSKRARHPPPIQHPPPLQHPPPIRRAIARMRRKARRDKVLT